MSTETNLPPPSRPLPVTITPGMTVISVDGNPTSKIVGITQSYCVYLLNHSLFVDRWENLALSGICPAPPLLPRTVDENDRLNAAACALKEHAYLKSLGASTPTQDAAMDELTRILCPSPVVNPVD